MPSLFKNLPERIQHLPGVGAGGPWLPSICRTWPRLSQSRSAKRVLTTPGKKLATPNATRHPVAPKSRRTQLGAAGLSATGVGLSVINPCSRMKEAPLRPWTALSPLKNSKRFGGASRGRLLPFGTGSTPKAKTPPLRPRPWIPCWGKAPTRLLYTASWQRPTSPRLPAQWVTLRRLPGSGVSTHQAGVDHQTKARIDGNQAGRAQPEPRLVRGFVHDGLAKETQACREQQHACLRLQVPDELGTHRAGVQLPLVYERFATAPRHPRGLPPDVAKRKRRACNGEGSHAHSCCLHGCRTHWPGPWRWGGGDRLFPGAGAGGPGAPTHGSGSGGLPTLRVSHAHGARPVAAPLATAAAGCPHPATAPGCAGRHVARGLEFASPSSRGAEPGIRLAAPLAGSLLQRPRAPPDQHGQPEPGHGSGRWRGGQDPPRAPGVSWQEPDGELRHPPGRGGGQRF